MARRTKALKVLTITPAQCAEFGIDSSTRSETNAHGTLYIVGQGRGQKVYMVPWEAMQHSDTTVHGRTYRAPA